MSSNGATQLERDTAMPGGIKPSLLLKQLHALALCSSWVKVYSPPHTSTEMPTEENMQSVTDAYFFWPADINCWVM